MEHETFHSQMMYSVTMAIVRKSLKEAVPAGIPERFAAS